MSNDTIRLTKCKNCKGCSDWLDECSAECCKGFYLPVPDSSIVHTGMILRLHKVLVQDLQLYYRLHGCPYQHGILYIRIDEFYIVGPKEIFVVKRCQNLTDDLKCKAHGTDRQPKVCATPAPDNYDNLHGSKLTPNCLYKYHKQVRDQEATNEIL